MAKKENKGGILHNSQVEDDLRVKGKDGEREGYAGAQDNGDGIVRTTGNEVQQRDGFAQKAQRNEEE